MNGADLPFSQACENNKAPILAILRRHLDQPHRVLEIGSGTGQHAVYFAAELPHLTWQPSDLRENLPGVAARVRQGGLTNVLEPIELDVESRPWPIAACDAVFSANTAHIMSWSSVQRCLAGVGAVLSPGGRFFLYGPFNYDGAYTSPSNEEFDGWLRRRDPASGIRDFEEVAEQAARAGLEPVEDNQMPANNRLLIWRRP